MKIQKPEIKVVPKRWGREEWLANTDLYCLKFLYINKGWRCSMHHHKIKDETFFLERGLIYLELEDEERIMRPGDLQRIKPYQKHRFTGLEDVDSKLIEVSTHHEDSDSYRDEIGGKIDLDKLVKELKEKRLL